MKITLKAARVNIGMTLKEAAALFGINRETLSNYESDSTNVPRTFFIRIESVYGIPVEYIYFGKQQEYQTSLLQEHA
jgi:transcriptional regulator with XRE-family HTH domain